MNYAYIRVSTDKQTMENQKYEIEKFCAENEIAIDKWIEETISASVPLPKRKLSALIRKMKPGDLMIASELSRLGRNLLQVMGILNGLMTTGARAWTIRDNYRLGDDIPSKVLAFAFGLSAEIERKLISQRTREALAARRAAGVVLGRPLGSRNRRMKLTGRESQVLRLLAKKCSKSRISRKLRVSRGTLDRFVKSRGLA
jgi:DNA invertase Pin-like site-specific DNA recombinase